MAMGGLPVQECKKAPAARACRASGATRRLCREMFGLSTLIALDGGQSAISGPAVPALSRARPLPQVLHRMQGCAVPVGAGVPAKGPAQATAPCGGSNKAHGAML